MVRKNLVQSSLITLSSRVLAIFKTCYFIFCCSPSLSSTSQFWLCLKITHWKSEPSGKQTKKGRGNDRKPNKSTLMCFLLRPFFFFWVIWITRHLNSYYRKIGFVSLYEYLHLFLPEGNELHHGTIVPSHAMGSLPVSKRVDKALSSVLIASPSNNLSCCSEVSLALRFF